jgi:hypothetical protein
MPFQRMPDALFSRAVAEMRRDGEASRCAYRLPRPAFRITLLAIQESTASDRARSPLCLEQDFTGHARF